MLRDPKRLARRLPVKGLLSFRQEEREGDGLSVAGVQLQAKFSRALKVRQESRIVGTGPHNPKEDMAAPQSKRLPGTCSVIGRLSTHVGSRNIEFDTAFTLQLLFEVALGAIGMARSQKSQPNPACNIWGRGSQSIEAARFWRYIHLDKSYFRFGRTAFLKHGCDLQAAHTANRLSVDLADQRRSVGAARPSDRDVLERRAHLCRERA
jgi:hypothetical protein